MAVIFVDISRKCNLSCRCPGNGAGLIKAKKGTVAGADSYEYCTHTFSVGYWIKELKYNNQPLQIENGGRAPSNPFSGSYPRLEVVTVYYYHGTRDSNSSAISTPLLLGIKDNDRGNYKWYENLARNNLTWKPISTTSGFPSNDTEVANPQFKKNLDRVACSLHKLHRVDIKNDQPDPYCCPVCGEAKVNVQKSTIYGDNCVYNKLEHIPKYLTGDETYAVTYRDHFIQYQRNGHWVNLQVDKNYCERLSVYYWDGDIGLNTPLLTEAYGQSGVSTWFENTGDNRTWINITGTPGFTNTNVDYTNSKFKSKLDVLNCKLGKVVNIDLSKDKDEEYCHHGHERGYNEKIRVKLNPDTFSFPNYVLFEHTPNSGTELTIGGFNIGGTPQTGFSGLKFPFKATKITVFMPACDHNKPFLFHVASKQGQTNNRWFQRTNGSSWKEITSDSNFRNTTPDKANKEVRVQFTELTKSLGVTPCSAPGTVQLDVTKVPSPGKNETVYFYGNTPILVKKVVSNDLPNVFLKYSHTPPGDGEFTVSTALIGGSQIGTMTHRKVQGFFVYFWTGNDNLPILVGIKKSSWQDGSDQPKYYSKGNSGYSHIWTPTWVSGMSEVQALDDQNCSFNGAIPVNLNNPTNPDQFLSISNKSSCLKNYKKITRSTSTSSPPNSDYTVQEYNVSGGYTQISRVTFDGRDTTGITLPKDYTVSRIRVYSYPGNPGPPEIPLMLQFIPKGNGESKWFESNDTSGTDWGTVNVTAGFYNETGNQPTEKLTTELDGIRCVRDNEVTLDLSYAVSSTQAPYCCNSHNTGSGYNVTVTLQSTTIIGSKALDYYKHSLTANTKLAAIKYYPHGTSDTRKYIRPSELTLPTTEQTTIYVFYCPKDPVLIYISSPGEISATGWYKKSTSAGDDSKWIKVLIGLKDPNNIKGCSPEFDLLSEVLRGLNCTDIGTCNQSKAHTKVDVSFDISSMQHSKGDVGSKGPAGSSAPPGDPGEGTQDTSTGSRSDSGLLGSLVGDMGVLLGKAGETVINLLTTPLKTNDFISPSPKTQTAAGDQSSDGAAHTDVNSPSGRETGDRVQADGTAIQDGLGPPAPGAASSEPKDDTEDNQPGGGVSYSGTAGSPTTCGGSNDPAPPPPPPQPGTPTSKVTAEDEAPAPAESGKTERSTGGLLELPIATSLWSTFGVSSGPLAGAGGLTGFGWWMFKRSKGDPWVRQVYLMDQ